MHTGRHTWDQVHLIDLVTGTVSSLPKIDGLTRRALGVHGGALFFSLGPSAPRYHRWLPGQEPQPLDLAVAGFDPVSGSFLAYDKGSPYVLSVDGSRHEVPAGKPYLLAPAGTRLYDFRDSPPAVTLLRPGEQDAQEHPLPGDCETSTSIPMGPVWEDADTLLFTVRHAAPRARIVRWRLETGVFEHFELPANAGYRPRLVEPVLSGY
jgi:hypothetical protein